jgi:hypothetical protein
MRLRSTSALLMAAALSMALAGSAAAVRGLAIYGNNMDSPGKRAQMVKLSGRNCDRGGSPQAFKIEVGERTQECIYRTPVVGRDVEIFATARLLSGTPRDIRKRVFVAVNLRNGGGAKYQLAVFPAQRKFQLRKVMPDGTLEFLAIGKRIKRIRGTNKANRLRLRAFNIERTRDRDDCRLLVYIGDKRFAVVTDRRAGPLQGRYVSVSVGSRRAANGAVGSFDDALVRVPSPF